MAISLSVSGLAGGGGQPEENKPAAPAGMTEVTDPKILQELGMTPEPAAPAGKPATVQIPAPQARDVPATDVSGGLTEVTDPAILRELMGESSTEQSVYGESVANGLRQNLSNKGESKAYALDRFKGGVADSLAIAGLPASVAGTILETLGIVPKGETFGGYAMIQRGYKNLFDVKGVAQPTDQFGNKKSSDEYIGAMAEFMGGALIPGAGAAAVAERKLATALTQAAAALAAGDFSIMGKHLAENYGPMLGISKQRSGEIGQMVGGFGGSLLPFAVGQTITKAFGGAAKVAADANVGNLGDVTKKLSAEQMSAANSAAIKEEIVVGLESYPQSLENAARAIALKKKIDNFLPLPAQLTDSPALIGMYNQVAKTNPQALGRAQAVENANLAALEAYRLKNFPIPADGVGITSGAKATVQAKAYLNGTAMQNLQDTLQALSTKFLRTVDNNKLGIELRDLYYSQRAAAKRNTEDEVQALYRKSSAIGLKEDMGITRLAVQELVSRDGLTFQTTPPVMSEILNKYGGVVPQTTKLVPSGLMDAAGKPLMNTVTVPATGNSTASFEELHSLYKRLNKDINAATTAGQGTTSSQLYEVKNLLQKQLSKYSGEQYGEFAADFNRFNNNYSIYAGTFKEGLGGQMAARTRLGYSTDSEDIVRKLIVHAGDKRQGLIDFSNIYNGDAKAAEILHDGVLDMFSKKAVVNGTLDPKAAQTWIANHREMLQEMPEMRGVLDRVTANSMGLVNRQLELKVEASKFNETIISKIAGHNNPEEVIKLALRDDKYMKGLLYSAETDENKRAIARGIMDHVWKQSDPLVYLQDNAKSLKPALDALGPNHWENLKTLGLGKTISDRVKAPTSVPIGKVQDIGESTVGIPVKGLFSRFFNPIQSNEYRMIDVAGRYIFKVKMEGMAKMREAAMLDPQMAEAVVAVARAEVTGGPSAKQLLNLQKMSFAHGIMSFTTAVGVQNDRRTDAPVR